MKPCQCAETMKVLCLTETYVSLKDLRDIAEDHCDGGRLVPTVRALKYVCKLIRANIEKINP